MSQRLVANKRPTGQTLQTSSGSTAHMQDSRKLGVPKRKPRNAKRSIEANGNSAQKTCGDEGSNCVRIDCHNCLEKDDEDFMQIMKKNVFFDSYYPKLQGDFSEDYDGSKKSQSSTVGINSNNFSSEILKVGDSLKTDSNILDTSKGICFFNSMVEPIQSTKYKNIKASDQHSMKSRLTFDSNTYTLHSNGSDHESAESRTSGKDNNDTTEQNNDSPSDEHQNTSDEKAEAWDNEDEIKTLIKSAEESREALSAVDCFTHLYKRIETLEDLLQQTLANSVEQKQCKCVEKPKNREKLQPSKTKFSASKISESKKQLASSPRACGDPSKADATEEKENPDTDNELRSIKKRLRALERKLKQAKTSTSVHSVRKTCEPPLGSKSSEISDERVNEKCCCRMYSLMNAKESDYTRPISETDYFLPSEMLVLTRSELLSEKDSSEWNLKSEVKRKIISNCKRIKKKCSSIISSRRNKNHPLKIINKCNEIFTGESADTTCPCRSFSAHIKGDNKTPILYVKCPHAHAHKTHLQKRPRKKRLKKIKQLCKKNSLTNFVAGQGEGNQEWEPVKLQNESNDTSASLECDRTSASDMENDKYVNSKKFKRNDWSKTPWVNAPLPDSNDWPPRAYYMTFPYDFPPNSHSNNDCMQWKNSRGKSENKKAKPVKKQSPFRNPIEILKRGGKIRIPVLFEEVCKTLKAKKPSHKVSNVSMRFVLVERDPKHPLKKLIKKLSNGKTPTKVERYVFGVSKCCCENEMNNSKREKSGKRKFNGV